VPPNDAVHFFALTWNDEIYMMFVVFDVSANKIGIEVAEVSSPSPRKLRTIPCLDVLAFIGEQNVGSWDRTV
jgi:hypothetical protein